MRADSLFLMVMATSIWEQKVDWATRNGTIFVNAAGNEGDDHGYYSIVNPATAKNVIAVGATNHWYQDGKIGVILHKCYPLAILDFYSSCISIYYGFCNFFERVRAPTCNVMVTVFEKP